MTVRRTKIIALAPAALLALVAGCSSTVDKAGGEPATKPVTLHVVTALGGAELQPFVDAVARISHGALLLDVEEKWHLGVDGAEQQSIEAVRSGEAPLGVAPVRAWNAVGVRSFDALVAPLVVDSAALQSQVISGPLAARMLAGPSALGLTGLGILPGPMRRPVGVSHNLRAPGDYAGLLLGISPSAVTERTFAALHAKTQASPFQGAPISAYGGLEAQIAAVEGNQYDGVATSITANVSLWPRPMVVFANAAAFRKLSHPQQTTLRRAAHDAIAATAEFDAEQERGAVDILCRRGAVRFITASPDDIAHLHAAVRPVLDQLAKDPTTREVLAGIEQDRTSVGAKDRAPSCTPDSDAPAAAPDRSLDGVWKVTTTEKELRAAGVADTDVVPENWGHFVYVVSDGRFAFTQANDRACTWGFGTWTITGPTLTWIFGGGGGKAPNKALTKAGEKIVQNWSLFQDTLTLTAPDGTGPSGFQPTPWKRVATTPSLDRLSQSCPPPADALTR